VRSVFVDANHYIAIILPFDDLHERALEVAESLTDATFVTTDAVLLEVLAYVAGRGPEARQSGVALVDRLRSSPATEIVPMSRRLFDEGLALYRERLDKGYSLTDCISMVLCRDRGITDVLSHDAHFRQEGLVTLL
jgi:predicted nucleic acid-binding protein